MTAASLESAGSATPSYKLASLKPRWGEYAASTGEGDMGKLGMGQGRVGLSGGRHVSGGSASGASAHCLCFLWLLGEGWYPGPLPWWTLLERTLWRPVSPTEACGTQQHPSAPFLGFPTPRSFPAPLLGVFLTGRSPRGRSGQEGLPEQLGKRTGNHPPALWGR